MRSQRSTGEVIVLILALVVAVIMISTALAVLVVEIQDPASDTSGVTGALLGFTANILSALLGLITGRALRESVQSPPPPPQPPASQERLPLPGEEQ